MRDKVALEDQILSFETKRSSDRRCEFWLEFENGVKMFAEMLDPAQPQTSLIAPLGDGDAKHTESHKRVLIFAESQDVKALESQRESQRESVR